MTRAEARASYARHVMAMFDAFPPAIRQAMAQHAGNIYPNIMAHVRVLLDHYGEQIALSFLRNIKPDAPDYEPKPSAPKAT